MRASSVGLLCDTTKPETERWFVFTTSRKETTSMEVDKIIWLQGYFRGVKDGVTLLKTIPSNATVQVFKKNKKK